MSERIVIVGGVAAGPKAACRVKRLMQDAQVTIIDQDTLISYGGCGIPYYVSGDVSDESELRATSFHMVRDEAFFKNAKGVDVLSGTRAVAIDRQNKQVKVQSVASGEEREIPYDKLMLATGSQPFVLPIPGNDLDGVFTISNLHKAIEIKRRIARGKVGKAVVIGGGAIGLEMAEALADLWEVETTVLEFMDQVLPRIVDAPMAAMVVHHMRNKDVTVHLGEGAAEILGEDGQVTGVRTAQRTIDCDLVIMAAGVRPRSELAGAAGLQISPMGAIVVNERMQTSDPAIYAAGDCVEVMHLISGKKFYAPLGSLANKEGRVVGDNMAGIPSTFKGALGSFIMKAFDVCVGATGLSLDVALAEGYDADVALTAPSDRAHFFPTEAIVCYQMVFDRRTRKVLGLQGFGPMGDGISARIDAAAAYLAMGATIDDFGTLEMAYAPPFSAAIDAINAVAYVADNLCDGRLRKTSVQSFLDWMDNFSSQPDWVALDIRHPAEATPFVTKYGADLWCAIPYNEVRQRYRELPVDKTMVILCDAGTRSFEVQSFLNSVGVTNTLVLSGGFNVVRRMGVDWYPQND
ncbi:MAG: FAD-dependent oxidoreductase [Desulfobulbaceae bacterium]|uniref:FAD-dependent oxidoreductase n=1 Tax=Candidatus Desulfatifera sulfidica TaxID=2841691 RepID=A0A8J6N924_9BACT|nr:FAD-dependent oxidoreductase [Candidatus Desulfatifera sulfidica]